MKRVVGGSIVGMLLVFLIVGVAVTSRVNSAPSTPVDWVVGDVFVAIGNGSYNVYHSANPTAANPTYNPMPVQTISDTLGGTTAGCAFDSAYRFFGTNFSRPTIQNITQGQVDRYSIDFEHGLTEAILNSTISPVSSHPESIVFGGSEDFFVGYADNSQVLGSGGGAIEHWALDTSTGHFVRTNAYPVNTENRGADWIDLASNNTTIFYTSEGRLIKRFDTALGQLSDFADLGTAGGSQVTLFAVRILQSATGFNGVLVADKRNLKRLNSSGAVAQTYDASGQDDWEAVSLDPKVDAQGNPISFWAGDATTHNFYRFNIASGAIEVGPINTQSGLGGICVEGGFSAAQLASFPQPSPPAPTTQTFPLSSTTTNTLNFTSPFTQATLTATLVNLQNSVNVTVRDSLVDPPVAQSDPTVFSFYFLDQQHVFSSNFPGNMPCDTTLTALHGFRNTCESFEVEANPNSGFDRTNYQIVPSSADIDRLPDTPNLRFLRNLDEDITNFVIDYPLGGTRTKCVITVNTQTPSAAGAHSCGFSSPSSGQNFTKSSTSSIPFKFQAVAAGGDCQHGPFLTDQPPNALQPLLMIVQQVPGGPAPNPIQVIVAGKSGGPPIFLFSGNTWQLQVKTSDMPAGFTYVATVIDLNNVIPSFSATFTLK